MANTIMTITKQNIVEQLIAGETRSRGAGESFAPANLALIKYWGKRDQELNLPITPSLSVSMAGKGAYLVARISDQNKDIIRLNDAVLTAEHPFVVKVVEYLELFRCITKHFYNLDFAINLPLAAGLASSSCIFAAVVKALNKLYAWNLSAKQLSVLARLGSGSACRSIEPGFVTWQAGSACDGMDSYAKALDIVWSELRIGLLIVDASEKKISSRVGMQMSVATSSLYADWPKQVARDMEVLQQALANKDFELLGKTAENNAIAMHKLATTAEPVFNYSQQVTELMKQKVIEMRDQGVQVYFTQDAGPNLKLLFLEKANAQILEMFPDLEILAPFVKQNIDEVILVDANDKAVGTAEKLAAHREGNLHRAFSVIIYRKNQNKIELLLQKRQHGKYHSGGLWANSCCSHPRPNEHLLVAAKRRLREELGIGADLKVLAKFQYRAKLDSGLTEHELDTVLIGEWQQDTPLVNDAEIAEIKWQEASALQHDLQQHSGRYAEWFPQVLQIFMIKFIEAAF